MWNPFNRNAKPEAKKKRRKTPICQIEPCFSKPILGS